MRWAVALGDIWQVVGVDVLVDWVIGTIPGGGFVNGDWGTVWDKADIWAISVRM